MSDELKIEYTEVGADAMVQYWCKDYERTVERHEWFYDASKKRFVLKLYVRSSAQEKP